MERKNSDNVSLSFTPKETLVDRIQTLIKGRSIRAVSSAWGLPYSTLNNYLNKGTDPSFKAIQVIAEAEKVSLDWLAFGSERSESESPIDTLKYNKTSPAIRNAWDMVYESLSDHEINELLKVIHRKGIEGILQITKTDSLESSIDNLHIRPTLKQAIKLAMAGDESLDQEILRRIEEKKNTDETGHLSQEEDHQKVG
ncbi:TPA: helix-turn-helix transcriptional regulator [Morganella morganii]|uniref:helix-turn-helix domain-containing protein n=1 Tax=Morganella morganii TaxID=582 RepID=UPI001CA5DCCD|nr:helix-turn-helix transcriptional regulator [Morganella morganii]MBW5405316.1 helix-turn-helix transcriptional regulator [Morganella morganii]MDN3816832.1 helix-turn-helix transcriptional regulator [Morganella morganii]HDU8545615.1 helix-turn-helix transcriptional regulator [Morganella morganii]